MTIDIQKAGHHRAIVTVDGRAYQATFDPSIRRWRVTTDAGDQITSSPKLHSIGRIFQPAVTISGKARAPKPRPGLGMPRPPRAPRQPRAPRVGRKGGPAFAPKPSPRDLMLVASAATEDALVAKLGEPGARITDDARKSFEKLKKLKALALGPTTSTTAQTEAFAALRMSLIEAIKLVF